MIFDDRDPRARMRFHSLLQHRQLHRERAAARRSGSVLHASAVFFRDPPHDVKAQARSRTGVASAETLEETFAPLLGDPVAVIFHGDFNPLTAATALHGHMTVARG